MNTAVFIEYTFDSPAVSGVSVGNSGNGQSSYNAQLENGATTSVTDGMQGDGSLQLDAAYSQHLRLPDLTTGTGGLTFAFWFRSSGSGNWARLLDFGNGGGSDSIYLSIVKGFLVADVFGSQPKYVMDLNNVNCSASNFCVAKINDRAYCLGSFYGCLWGSNDCTVSADCDKYKDTQYLEFYSDADCVGASGGWQQQVCLETIDTHVLAVNDNVWRHVAWTLQPSGVWTVYINGTGVWNASGQAYPQAVNRNSNFLGKSYSAADPYFNGAIDDFRMYQTALSAGAVKALYTGE